MSMDTEKRTHKLFAGVSSPLKKIDPEFAEIIVNFSQGEVVKANKLTEKEQMLCILSALLGCPQCFGAYQIIRLTMCRWKHCGRKFSRSLT